MSAFDRVCPPALLPAVAASERGLAGWRAAFAVDDSPGRADLDLGAILTAAAVAVIAIITALVARYLDVEIDVGLSPARFKINRRKPPSLEPPVLPPVEPPAPSSPTEAERERVQLREAMFAFSEQVQALEALLSCKPPERDRYAREWFDSLANGLETALRTSTTERYRASLWANRADPDNFDAAGLGRFGQNDVRMQKLLRIGTIGGDAYASSTGEKYCPDIRDPACGWRQRGPNAPKYASLFAIALVALDNDGRRWGVMTVDCNEKGGFSQLDQQVARHFGELASLGELIWRRKEAPPIERARESG
jgi:hypothetical protein